MAYAWLIIGAGMAFASPILACGLHRPIGLVLLPLGLATFTWGFIQVLG